MNEGPVTEILCDASTTGLGACLVEDGTATECFHDELTVADEKVLGHRRGSSDGQQAWESLVILVALRIWSSKWRGRRITLRVASDSVTALTALVKMKATGHGPAVVARELALDIAEALYDPSVVEHIPGVSNVAADWLSRAEKRSSSPMPPSLRNASFISVPRRSSEWWRSLA